MEHRAQFEIDAFQRAEGVLDKLSHPLGAPCHEKLLAPKQHWEIPLNVLSDNLLARLPEGFLRPAQRCVAPVR